MLEYDDVMNKQREVIYEQRERILAGEDLREDVVDIIERVLRTQVGQFTGESTFAEEWDLEELFIVLRSFYPDQLRPGRAWATSKSSTPRTLVERVVEDALKLLRGQRGAVGADNMSELERWVLLRTLDSVARPSLRDGLPA